MELAVAKEELFYKVEKCWETGTQRRVSPGAGRHHTASSKYIVKIQTDTYRKASRVHAANIYRLA